jgi:hypothetical protein
MKRSHSYEPSNPYPRSFPPAYLNREAVLGRRTNKVRCDWLARLTSIHQASDLTMQAATSECSTGPRRLVSMLVWTDTIFYSIKSWLPNTRLLLRQPPLARDADMLDRAAGWTLNATTCYWGKSSAYQKCSNWVPHFTCRFWSEVLQRQCWEIFAICRY